MILKMYVIYDSKTEAFLLPHFFRSRGEAIRAFTAACNDSHSQLCTSPSDFTFFEVGSFDDSNGCVSMYDSKISLGTALELKTIKE